MVHLDRSAVMSLLRHHSRRMPHCHHTLYIGLHAVSQRPADTHSPVCIYDLLFLFIFVVISTFAYFVAFCQRLIYEYLNCMRGQRGLYAAAARASLAQNEV